MSNILIKWLWDEHDCETCGWSASDGAEVYIDDKPILALKPVAYCFDNTNYSRDDVYRAILEHLGHTVEEDTDDED